MSFSYSFSLLCCFNFILIGVPKAEWDDIDGERKEERIRPKKRELHELPYKEMVKSGNILREKIFD